MLPRINLRSAFVFVVLLVLTACKTTQPLLATSVISPLQPVWQQRVMSSSSAHLLQPTTYNDKLLLANNTGTLVLVDKDNGDSIWRRSIKQTIDADPVLDDKYYYLISKTTGLSAYAINSGCLMWQLDLPGEVISIPVLAEHVLYIVTLAGHVLAVDATSGRLLWQHFYDSGQVAIRTNTPVLLIDQSVLATFADGHLLALDQQRGEPLWSTDILSERGYGWALHMTNLRLSKDTSGPLLYIAHYRQGITTVRSPGGEVVWQYPLPIQSAISVGRKTLAAVDNTQQLWLFDKATGRVLWRKRFASNRQLSQPLIIEPYLMLADSTGVLSLFQLDDGALVDQHRFSQAATLTKLVKVAGQAVLFTERGNLLAYQLLPVAVNQSTAS